MTKTPERSARELELQDRLDDVLNGIRLWENIKVGKLDWSEADEMLKRWIEASE